MGAPIINKKRRCDSLPHAGLTEKDFFRICSNGFGDGHNAFPHSAAWFREQLFVGITRSNFQLLKIHKVFEDMPVHLWPVDGPTDADGIYRELDRRAQIWRYDPSAGKWEGIYRSVMVPAVEGNEQVARETGLRAMAIFKAPSDDVPALYVSSWAPGRAPGALLLRTVDGQHFEPASPYGIIRGLPITASRVLIPFRDKLYTSPTGIRGHGVKMVINVCGYPTIFETRDPSTGDWQEASKPGFGDVENLGVFSLCVFNDQLYAGTLNNSGLQVWRSKCEGKPPYKWVKVVDKGADRGPLNQVVVSMKAFNGALYVGGGIQNGGYDRTNKIGPAASELIRINPDDSWDLIVGTARNTSAGHKVPLSGLPAGFGSPFNGYFWCMEEHDGWLYLGTMCTSLWLRYMKVESYPVEIRGVIESMGVERILEQHRGCHVWRSADGENWLPVTHVGFDNEYNYGVRNIVSTPVGLFLAIANPFGPRVAVLRGGVWVYEDNARGGLEIWHGNTNHAKVHRLEQITETAIWE